jgi:hypothetical protein
VKALVVALLLVAAVVNLAPVVGVLSNERLRALYGVPVDDPNLAVLLRHRAVLFGIVGGLLVASAIWPGLRGVAAAAGLVSMLSFVALVFLVAGAGPELVRIARIDVAASVALLAAALLDAWSRTSVGR